MAIPVDIVDSELESIKFGQMSRPDINFLGYNTKRNISKAREIESITENSGGREKSGCLCDIVKNMSFICQFSGIMPVKHDEKNCAFVHSWSSVWPWVNLIWLVGMIILTIIYIPQLFRFFSNQYQGTNFYTYSISMIVQIISALMIYGFGSYNTIQIEKAWPILHALSSQLVVHKLKRMKYIMMLPTFYLLIELTVATAMTYYAIQPELPNQKDNFQKVFPINTFLSIFVPELLAGCFIVVLWIIDVNFGAINVLLENILNHQKDNPWDISGSMKLAKLKRQHEDLCEAVRFIQDGFGISILALFIGTSVTFVSAIYGLVLVIQDLISPDFAQGVFWNSIESLFLCGFRLGVIVLICERVMNSANRPARILSKFDEFGQPECFKSEVNRYLFKIGNFPLRLRCCNIFDLGVSFIASGTSNIVTYTLILMQFKQADEQATN